MNNGLIRSLDVLILSLVFILFLLLICGEFSFGVGSGTFTVKKEWHFALVLMVLFLTRWLLARSGRAAPFSFGPRSRWAILRLVEIGILVHLVMVPVIFIYGSFQVPFFASPALVRALGVIYLLLWVRLILGRHLRGLTLLISTTATLVIVFVGMELFLRGQESRQLRVAMEKQEAQMLDPKPIPVKPPTKATAAADTNTVVEDEPVTGDGSSFDPTLNDGVNWTWGHPIVNNRYGFREKEFESPKPEGLFRIMILGDSLTWGAGLAPEQRYSDRLQTMLTEAVSDRPVEVLNFGFQGGPTVHERDLLVSLQDEVDPDLIIVGFCFNDTQPRSQNYSIERSRIGQLYGLIAQMRHLGLQKTYAFLISRIDHVLGRAGSIPTWEEALDRTYDPESREWKDFQMALEEIKRISDQRQLPTPVFILLVQGMAADRPDPDHYPGWFAQAGSAAKASGFSVVDPTSRFLGELKMSQLPVNPRDGHPSAACNLIYAQELFPFVRPLVEYSGGPTLQTGD